MVISKHCLPLEFVVKPALNHVVDNRVFLFPCIDMGDSIVEIQRQLFLGNMSWEFSVHKSIPDPTTLS